jgi:hypothetical protein
MQKPAGNTDKRWTAVARGYDESQRKRLKELANIGVARYMGENAYELEGNWKETLKTIGRYNTFLHEKQKTWDLEFFNASSGRITGKVVNIISMNDEDVWNNAVVVRNGALGKTWYVPLYNPADEKLLGKDAGIAVRQGKNGRPFTQIQELNKRVLSNKNIDKNSNIDVRYN